MATLVYYNSFENSQGDAIGYVDECRVSPDPDAQFTYVSPIIAGVGSEYSLRTFQDGTLGCAPTGKHRTEVRHHKLPNVTGESSRACFGWAMKIPLDFPATHPKSPIIAQWIGDSDGPEYLIKIDADASEFVVRAANQANSAEVVVTKFPFTRGTVCCFVVERVRGWDGGDTAYTSIKLSVDEGAYTEMLTASQQAMGNASEYTPSAFITFKTGIYWATDLGVDTELFWDEVRVATGSDGFDLVDPLQILGAPPVPDVPTGFTAVDITALTGYTETSTSAVVAWAGASDTDAYPNGAGTLRYTKDSGAASGYATIYTATETGTLGLYLYVPYRSGRTDSATWALTYAVGGGAIASGTFSQNGASANNEWIWTGEHTLSSTGAIRLTISYLGSGTPTTEYFLAVDAAAYKFNAAPAADPPVLPIYGSWVSPISAKVKNTGEFEVDVVAEVTSGGSANNTAYGTATSKCSIRNTGVAGDPIYITPLYGESGIAQFSCYVSDPGNANSATTIGTFTITNTTPVAIPRTTTNTLYVEAGTTTDFDMTGWGTDADGDPLTYAIGTAVDGALTASVVTGDTLRIVAPAGTATYNAITFTVTDGTATTAAAATTIEAVVASTPTLTAGTADVFGNSFDNLIDVLASATEPNGLQVYIYSVDTVDCTLGADAIDTGTGTVYNDAQLLNYEPDTGFIGTDTLSVKVWNGTNISTAADWVITVLGLVYDALTYSYDITLTEGQYVQASLDVAEDCGVFAVDGAITWSVLTQPSSGEVSVDSNGLVTFSHAYGPGRTVTPVIRAVLGSETRDFTLTLNLSRTFADVVVSGAVAMSRALGRFIGRALF